MPYKHRGEVPEDPDERREFFLREIESQEKFWLGTIRHAAMMATAHTMTARDRANYLARLTVNFGKEAGLTKVEIAERISVYRHFADANLLERLE